MAMSPEGNTTRSRDADPHAPSGPEAPARFVHELANLLDGSLRNLGMALQQLRPDEPSPVARPADDAPATDDEQILRRLEVANDAMRQMATLLRRWMQQRQAPAPESLHQRAETLGHTIQHAVRLLNPIAAAQQIVVAVDLDQRAADLPAGPLYPVLANALRNSIDAITGARSDPQSPLTGETGRIDLWARVHADQVVLTIRDNGPGVPVRLLDQGGNFRFGATSKSDGGGLGLTLVRDIAGRLGGHATLGPRSDRRRGAELVFRVPLAAVSREAR